MAESIFMKRPKRRHVAFKREFVAFFSPPTHKKKETEREMREQTMSRAETSCRAAARCHSSATLARTLLGATKWSVSLKSSMFGIISIILNSKIASLVIYQQKVRQSLSTSICIVFPPLSCFFLPLIIYF